MSVKKAKQTRKKHIYICIYSYLHACWVAQSCLTLTDPTDCTLPSSSVHGISQARILEWVAISSSREFLNPGIEPSSPAAAWQADSLPLSHLGTPYACKHSMKVLMKSKVFSRNQLIQTVHEDAELVACEFQAIRMLKRIPTILAQNTMEWTV